MLISYRIPSTLNGKKEGNLRESIYNEKILRNLNLWYIPSHLDIGVSLNLWFRIFVNLTILGITKPKSRCSSKTCESGVSWVLNFTKTQSFKKKNHVSIGLPFHIFGHVRLVRKLFPMSSRECLRNLPVVRTGIGQNEILGTMPVLPWLRRDTLVIVAIIYFHQCIHMLMILKK